MLNSVTKRFHIPHPPQASSSNSGAVSHGNNVLRPGVETLQGVAANWISARRKSTSLQPFSARQYGTVLSKSTSVPTTDLSRVGPTITGYIAAISRWISESATPNRRRRCPARAGSRSGSCRTCRAGSRIESSEREDTSSKRGCRSTTNRFTYQSPRAVSASRSSAEAGGSHLRTFFVALSITIPRHSAALKIWHRKRSPEICRNPGADQLAQAIVTAHVLQALDQGIPEYDASLCQRPIEEQVLLAPRTVL